METKGSILLIDQENEDALHLSSVLQERSYQITGASSAQEALLHLIDKRFDLVVLELLLPDRDGLTLIPEINLLAPEVPILVFTDLADADSVIEALRKGARDYILKPGNPLELLMRIEAVLQSNETSQ